MSFYEIRAKAEKAEVFLYDSIGEDVFGDGTSAKAFVDDLNQLSVSQLDVHINSPGGSVFDGIAIANAIERHPARTTSYVDGVAASIAGVIALAADEVVMARNSMFMVHDPWGMAMGSAEDIRAYADTLDKVRDVIAGVYEDKTQLEPDVIAELMAAETWMTASEAEEYGFADRVTEMKAAACAFDFSPFNYKHAPVVTMTSDTTPPAATAAEETEPAGEPDEQPEAETEAVESEGMSEAEYLRLLIT